MRHVCCGAPLYLSEYYALLIKRQPKLRFHVILRIQLPYITNAEGERLRWSLGRNRYLQPVFFGFNAKIIMHICIRHGYPSAADICGKRIRILAKVRTAFAFGIVKY